MRVFLSRLLDWLLGPESSPVPPLTIAAEPLEGVVLYQVHCNLREIAPPTFPRTLHAHRDLSDPARPEHLRQMCAGILNRGDGTMMRDKNEIIFHVKRGQHHVSISVLPADISALYDWAGEGNGGSCVRGGISTKRTATRSSRRHRIGRRTPPCPAPAKPGPARMQLNTCSRYAGPKPGPRIIAFFMQYYSIFNLNG